MVHLEPCNTQRAHDVRYGVTLGEHVLDLLTAVDEPLRHAVVDHRLLHLRLQALALTDGFHRRERQLGLHALVDEVIHDIVTAADAFAQHSRTGADQILCIAQPHVRTVGQAGNTDQLLHRGRLRIVQHASYEARAEFRNTVGAGGAVDLLARHAQRFGRLEQAAHFRAVQRNVRRRDAGQFLQHVDNRRVIVSEAVQLNQNIMHGVEVKMRGGEVALQIIRRMIDGRELVDLIFLRHNDHAARMLTRRALYADAARHQAFLFGIAGLDAALLKVLCHIAVRRFVREAGNRARAENVIVTEQLLHVMVRAVLIFAGEIQVDIGNLIAFKAKENLERDIEAVLGKRFAADGTVLIRQVDANLILALVHVEEALAAVGAAVMRRQCVNLRNAAEARHEARSDRSTRADQIAVVVGLFHQLLRDVVQRCKAVADDRFQFLFNTLDDNFRQFIAVHFLGRSPRHALDVIRCVLPQRLERILALWVLGEQLQLVHLIGNLARVGDNDLIRLFLAQIGKLLEHFVRRLEIQRRLKVTVIIAHARLDDGAVDRVVRVKEVHVARCHNGNAQFLAQLHDGAVEVTQAFVVFHRAVAHEERIVADGLNLQIIIEPRNLLEPIPARAVQHGMEQFARLAGTADDQALAVLLNQPARHMRTAAEVLQMSDRNKPVQVDQAFLRLDQQDNMIALANCAALDAVQVAQCTQFLFLRHLEHLRKALCRRGRVMHGAVRVLEADAQLLAHALELVALHFREQLA